MSALARVGPGLAHALANPVSGLLALAEGMEVLLESDPAALGEHLRLFKATAGRLGETLEDLRRFGDVPGDLRLLSLAELCGALVLALELRGRALCLDLDSDQAGRLLVWANPERLAAALSERLPRTASRLVLRQVRPFTACLLVCPLEGGRTYGPQEGLDVEGMRLALGPEGVSIEVLIDPS